MYSPPTRQIRLRWTRWTIGALLLPIIAISIGCASKMAPRTITAAAPGRQLQLVSTAWSPFTNVPGQARFALDLVDVALGRVGITAETVIVDEARLTPSLLSGEFDGSAALWRDTERERVLIYSQQYLENRLILPGARAATCPRPRWPISPASGSPWSPTRMASQSRRRTGRSSLARTAKRTVSKDSSTVRWTTR